MLNFTDDRQKMVRQHLALRGISDRRVIAAMLQVPREFFVPDSLRDLAYADAPLSIEEGQTISQPYVVALMALKAEVRSSDRVLEIGTGSGYAAAILAQLATHVYTVERHLSLHEAALQRFEQLGYTNLSCRLGDGSLGWPEQAPFDVIVVSAAALEIPQALIDQLVVGGRLVIPVGPVNAHQRLIKVVRVSAQDIRREDLGSVQFVPLISG